MIIILIYFLIVGALVGFLFGYVRGADFSEELEIEFAALEEEEEDYELEGGEFEE